VVLTLLSLLALIGAFAYLMISVGVQFPDTSFHSDDGPEHEERSIRKGAGPT
jgi:hypothetical protein